MKTKGTTGMHWYNNGTEQGFFFECPEGWHKGRLPWNSKSNTRSSTMKKYWESVSDSRRHFNLTEEQKQNLSNAKKRYYGSIR